MKSKIAVFVGAGIIICALAFVTAGQDDVNPLAVMANNPLFQSCGLNKLTVSEMGSLFKLCAPAKGQHNLEKSAYGFMEKNGWRGVYVMGAFIDSSTAIQQNQIVIFDNYNILALDPWKDSDPLPMPGYYWAKNSLTSWDLIYEDGTQHGFVARSID